MDIGRDSLENRLRIIRAALRDALGDVWYDMDLMHTFDDAVIVKNYDTAQFFRIPYTVDDAGVVSFGEVAEVDEVFILTSLLMSGVKQDEAAVKMAAMKAATRPAQLTAFIVKTDDEKRIVMGPVLVPGEPDSDGDVVTAEKIEEVAHKFLKDFRVLDLNHTLQNAAEPVESYLTPVELKYQVGDEDVVLPVGTWMMGAYVADDNTWAAVKSGELGGFSIWACAAENAAATAAAAKASSGTVVVDGHVHNVVTLAEMGDDWEVPAVSLVPTPAVPKAKFLTVKSAKPQGVLERLRALVSKKSEVCTATTASATVKDVGEPAVVSEEGTMDNDQVKELVESGIKSALEDHDKELGDTIANSVKEAVAPLTERLDAIEAAAKGEEAPEPEETDEVAALKAEIAELKEGIAELTSKVSKPGSRALKSEDADEAPESDRDGMGRRRRK